MPSRRTFLRLSAASPAVAPALAASSVPGCTALLDERILLNGEWEFRINGTDAWQRVSVPHTWQIEPSSAEHMGKAWYRRDFDVKPAWLSGVIRLEFEAVFHTARVWVNGKGAGDHTGKGYTAFTLDITDVVKAGRNQVVVQVDNGFNESMLPRGRSSDWTHDGGIYRPVSLLVSPKVYIERVDVDAIPDFDTGNAALEITALVRNAADSAATVKVGFSVIDESTALPVRHESRAASATLKGASTQPVRIASSLESAKLWHFDHPHLYRLRVEIDAHAYETIFGVRTFEVKGTGFYLNGERVFLAGVERMAGSNPELGMAEPESWISHDHDDMRNLNCVYTRVHWPQDKRLLDYCDRHGILIQPEVPTWGPATFKGMDHTPSAAIMQNGLQQLREMIVRDRNHPSIVMWGLCNEIGGQAPAAYEFAKRMYAEAKALDPRRPRAYASNSLQKTPERDVTALMDVVEWNEYYGSWMKGTPEDMRRNLEEIHRAFPGKPVVISEYGYCACTAERPEGDERRIEVLRSNNQVFRETDYVAGLIFFCYNDYRTHIGDQGLGVLKQRVHGVVDLYGNRKPSYEVLRRESSPVEAITVSGRPEAFQVDVRSRKSIPAYVLKGYSLRAIGYGRGQIPLEQVVKPIADLKPGDQAAISVSFKGQSLLRVEFDVIRPTGSSALSQVWTL
jgi:beta-glucuronidase